jgi:hypothetical protein
MGFPSTDRGLVDLAALALLAINFQAPIFT